MGHVMDKMASSASDSLSLATSSQAKLLSSSHRLPTVSASDALHNLGSNGPITLSSGLTSLDTLLAGPNTETSGGFPRGKIAELWGPNGSGKTGVMLQTATKCLLTGRHVVWLDAGNSLSGLRLKSMVEALGPGSDGTRSDEIRGFHYMSLSTLTNLLAMVLHPHPDFPPDETSLIVIDDINTIVDADFPRLHQFVTSSRTEQQKWQAGRRYAVLGSLMSGLHKFAALHDIAVIVSTGCSTRGRSSSGLPLALVPSVSGSDWEEGVHNKLAVFRDYLAHFVGVQKVQGKYLISREEVGEPGRIISFETTQAGVLTENVLSLGNGKAPVEQQMSVTIMPSPNKGYKRPYDEIADSEGEEVDEYGWAEADEDVLATESLAVKDTAGLKTDAAN